MKNKLDLVAPALATLFAVALLAMAWFAYESNRTFASAPSGVPATQYTATTTQVGPQATVTLFGANGSCASRIIRTQATDIYLLFGDPTNGDLASTSLTGVAGFTQAASTTVAYDSGIYGCGRVTAEATASTTVTAAEMF